MSIEELKKSPLVERIEKYAGGGMGNGERDNAIADAKKDLCICGPKTRAEQGCECEPEIASFIPQLTAWSPPQESILQEADRLVSTDRGSTYGPPSLDFGKVTGMALALWGRGPESPEEHALYMVLVKLARLQATPGHHDSIVDAAGYLKTYAMVIEERVKRITDKG